MASLIPEFISVLRDIRDNKYPEIVTKHDTVVAKEALVNPHYTAIDTVAGISGNVTTIAGNSADVTTVATDLNLGVASKTTIVADNIANVNATSTNIASVTTVAGSLVNIDLNAVNIVAIQGASANAITCTNAVATTNADVITTNNNVALTNADVVITTAKAVIAQQVLDMTASASTLIEGSPASADYNPTTGVMTLGIPEGATGEKGDPFVVNAVGLLADKSTYDAQPKGFSFLATDTSDIYFKLSNTIADWSAGAPFGKGDKGDTGTGIASITLTGTVGSVDTYRILYTDATFFDFDVTNGSVTSVAGRTGAVVLTKTDVGLENVDNTSDVLKPLSTATINALALKENKWNEVTKSTTYTAVAKDRIRATGTFTITAPPPLADIEFVILTDDLASVNVLTIAQNGTETFTFGDTTDTTLLIDINSATIKFKYDLTNTTWRIS